jgi:hypothetical protein
VRDKLDAWESFLNPDVVRAKLISAGLFLVAHEMLLDSIRRHPLSFFANRWTAETPEASKKYATEVLALDPKGKSDAHRGSIAWLRMMDVISENDEAAIRTATDVRNNLAHEMTSLVGDSSWPDLANPLATIMALVQKIEKWWIVNVEFATDPDINADEIDEEKIVSGPTLVMHLLAQVALGIGDEAWEFHREFQKLRTSNGIPEVAGAEEAEAKTNR